MPIGPAKFTQRRTQHRVLDVLPRLTLTPLRLYLNSNLNIHSKCRSPCAGGHNSILIGCAIHTFYAKIFATNFLATIQAIQRGSAVVEKSLAGYLRARRWGAEKPYDTCWSFSLIIVAIWLQATLRSLWIASDKRIFSILR